MKAVLRWVDKWLLAFLLVTGVPQSWSQDAHPMQKPINNNMTLQKIDTTVRAALPQGTTLADIDKYFTENHVEHSFYRPTNQVFAAVPNIKGGFFPVSKGAQIIIMLDKSERLMSLEVNAVMTGP